MSRTDRPEWADVAFTEAVQHVLDAWEDYRDGQNGFRALAHALDTLATADGRVA